MSKKMSLVLSKDEIAARVRQLALDISNEYSGKDLIIVGVLKGAFIFLADLARSLSIPAQIDFVQLSSYGSGTTSSGHIETKKDITLDIKGRNVLIVEDIVDTGLTIASLIESLQAHHPRSVKLCALISKKERREVNIPIDYVGYVVEQGFLVGYGLDFNECHRTLSEIYRLDV